MYKNLNEIELVEEAIKNCEGKLGKGGSLIVFTGEKTGRSPKDKHVVREKNTEEKIWWEITDQCRPPILIYFIEIC